MHRRALLDRAGVVASLALAGCVGGRRRDPANGTPTDDPPDSPRDGSPGATPPEPSATFAVTDRRCGSQTDRAEVTVDAGTVTVEGRLWGNDACYTARLAGVTLEGGTLTVRVAAERESRAGCAQCITEIDYRAVVEVAGAPERVVVTHRGEPVTTVRPG